MRATLLLILLLPDGGTADLIDRRIAERWQAENVRPAPPADDYQFFRRLSLDLRGALPTPEEIGAFAVDPDPGRREKTIDAWLRGEAFARHWSARWADDLGLQPALRDKFRELHEAFRGWLRDAVRSNIPYDRFVRRILTAKGPSDLDPAAGFLLAGLSGAAEGAKDVAERAARLFLGTQVRCAECHDHPFDDWTQADFYSMVSFFWQSRSEVRRVADTNNLIGWIEDDASKGDARSGDSKQARVHAPLYKPTGGTPSDGEPRRTAFARLLTADRQFARAAVNRHWGMLLGRGLVHPLDGFSAARKPSHPELLEELADAFAKSGFDVRRLLKSILLSKPYQLSSRGAAPDRLFARAIVSPMPAEQLFECLVAVTGVEEPARRRSAVKGEPRTLREVFLREFRPAFLAGQGAPGAGEATIAQALYLLNGELTAQAASGRSRGTLAGILDLEREPAKRLEQIFLSTLSRPPSPGEASALLERLRRKEDSRETYEDIFWALLNSTEFVTRH